VFGPLKGKEFRLLHIFHQENQKAAKAQQKAVLLLFIIIYYYLLLLLILYIIKNSVVSVNERTVPTERPPLVSEVSAIF
jgi:hypothetical protein